VLLLAGLGASCLGAPRAGDVSTDDSVLTARYVELQRARLTAKDPATALETTMCEEARISGLVGRERSMRALEAARHRAFPPEEEQMDLALFGSQLAGKSYAISREQCDSLARAGVLGDTVWPFPSSTQKR
jgi:hypothetical protein